MNISPETIINARVAANISRDTAAQLTCVSRRTWDSWETGQRNMPESSFRFFITQVTGEPLTLKIDHNMEHSKLLVFFDYSNGVIPIDCVSPEVFMAVELAGFDEAVVTSMTLHADGTRSPRKTKFKISDNEKNYNQLTEW